MNAQIEQLRKEIADKQKELETLEQFPYEKGQLVYVETMGNWIAEFKEISNGDFKRIESISLDSFSIFNDYCDSLCSLHTITTHRLATEADLNRLPDGHKWKHKKLPTTIEEIYIANNYPFNAIATQSSNKANEARVTAYRNLLEVIEWGNREWPEDIQHIAVKGLPNMSERTFKHIAEYFYNDLKTFQS